MDRERGEKSWFVRGKRREMGRKENKRNIGGRREGRWERGMEDKVAGVVGVWGIWEMGDGPGEEWG